MTRRAVRAAATAVLLGLLAACTALPESGPVVETGSTGTSTDDGGIFIDPRPPQPGASAADVVKGFLDAMTATPVRTDVAREFLTEEAEASWNPDLQTITYAGAGTPRGTLTVTVQLTGADRLDDRGSWRGEVAPPDDVLSFPMVLEDGEFRIQQAPDALIVPEQWFEERFRQVSLYFFDPSAQVLVPEPVFVPSGDQLATVLVRGLLRGPGSELARIVRTFVPPGVRSGLSVPVSADGVAEISLTDDAGAMSEQATRLMVAQLAWTLRQDPQIQSLRITTGGRPVVLPGGDSEFGVDEGSEYDPTGSQASSLLYGLRGGRLLAGPPSALEPVDSPFSTRDYGLSRVAVDVAGQRAAGVSDDGTAVLLGPVRSDGEVTQVVDGAVSLLRPAWDVAERIWLVDRAPGGARVSFVEDDRPRSVRVPGVTGQDVRAFLVSRDGSRLVAVVRRGGADSIVVSRILHSDQGRVLRATRAQDITWDSGGDQLRVTDLGWRSPTSVAVLHRLGSELFEVRSISVDGAPIGRDSFARTLRGPVTRLVASPVPTDGLYALTDGVLTELSGPRGGSSEVEPDIRSLGHAG